MSRKNGAWKNGKMSCKNVSKLGVVLILLILLIVELQPVIAAVPNLPNNSCADCHRRLIFTSEAQRKFIEIRLKHIESGISCSIVCHEDKLNKTTASTYALWSISTHALFGVTCEKCHGGNPTITSKEGAHAGLSNKSIARSSTPEMCGRCHKAQLVEFRSSKHYKILESGGEKALAPACITCHQAHSVRVLTASEIEDFCSNCHNNITGIHPDVPRKAEKALSLVSDLEAEISKARSAVISAKASGKDVTHAQEELESARAVLKEVPSVWHRFNLTYFETEVQNGITKAEQAKEEAGAASQVTPAQTQSPGFELILFISAMLLYIIRRR